MLYDCQFCGRIYGSELEVSRCPCDGAEGEGWCPEEEEEHKVIGYYSNGQPYYQCSECDLCGDDCDCYYEGEEEMEYELVQVESEVWDYVEMPEPDVIVEWEESQFRQGWECPHDSYYVTELGTVCTCCGELL